jgi:hypothetical protein
MKRNAEHEGKAEVFGQGLPGTGGDVARRGDDGSGMRPDGDGDVEGHLYRGGPTTQGEIRQRDPGESMKRDADGFMKRGPDHNPHGE